MDVEDVELGIPFMSRIQQAISQARLVIVVIGPHWDPSRLHDANDVVAYELRTAHRFARRVIPVVLARPAVCHLLHRFPAISSGSHN